VAFASQSAWLSSQTRSERNCFMKSWKTFRTLDPAAKSTQFVVWNDTHAKNDTIQKLHTDRSSLPMGGPRFRFGVISDFGCAAELL
jgi:hypothetical protein